MRRRALGALSGLVLLSSIGAGCDSTENATADTRTTRAMRQDRLERLLADPDSSRRGSPLARWILPPSLGEISGLALTADGRLMAHDDELGRITVVDHREGVLLSQFMLGDRETLADFEGLTIAHGVIYMVTSQGALYEFREGADGTRVRFTTHDTRLGDECEFEGVTYDAKFDALVMPCKTVYSRALRNHLVVYRWHLGTGAQSRLDRFTVPLRLVVGANDWRGLHPTDITVDPATGHYVMIASQEQALVEITRGGTVVHSLPLPGEHPRAEGVAITVDGILIVADEAGRASPSLTLYRWPLAATESDSP